ncbi:hypothetical protein ACHAQF_005351 [Verticillium nonalfalfae]
MQEIPKPPGLGTQVVEGLQQPLTPPTAKSEHKHSEAASSATLGSIQIEDDGCPSVIDDDFSQDGDTGGSLATLLRKVYKNDLKFAEKLIASIQQLPVREQRFLEAPGDFILQSTSPIDDSITETDEVSDAEASGSVYHGTPHTDGQSRHHYNDLEETPTSSQPADSGKDASSAGPKRPRSIDDLHSTKRQKNSGKGKERAGNSEEKAGNSEEKAGNSEERAGNSDSEGEDEGNEATSDTSGKHKTPAEDLPWPCPYYWKFSRGERQTVSSACYPRGNRPRYLWR